MNSLLIGKLKVRVTTHKAMEMAFPQKMFSVSKWRWFWISIFCFFVVAGGLRIYAGPYWTMAPLGLSACVIFYLLLEMKASRVAKGLSIIGFGAVVPVWSKVLFWDASLGDVATGSLEVMTQLFSLASAGAGGSIIAVHGEKFASDSDTATAPFQITSDTRRILELEQASRSQGRWIRFLCLLIGLLVVGMFVNLLNH